MTPVGRGSPLVSDLGEQKRRGAALSHVVGKGRPGEEGPKRLR
jgi:hypothetical protein